MPQPCSAPNWAAQLHRHCVHGAAGAPTFRGVVARVRTAVLSALANSSLPFAIALEAAAVPVVPAHAPAFTTMVNMLDIEQAPSRSGKQAGRFDAESLEVSARPCRRLHSKSLARPFHSHLS
jgi:hypothetical protein